MSTSNTVLLTIAAVLFTLGLTACNTRLSERDFEERCKNLESCLTESDFQDIYGSVEECVERGQNTYDDFEGECRKKLARAVNCLNRNFKCVMNQEDLSPCRDKIDEFENSDCSQDSF